MSDIRLNPAQKVPQWQRACTWVVCFGSSNCVAHVAQSYHLLRVLTCCVPKIKLNENKWMRIIVATSSNDKLVKPCSLSVLTVVRQGKGKDKMEWMKREKEREGEDTITLFPSWGETHHNNNSIIIKLCACVMQVTALHNSQDITCSLTTYMRKTSRAIQQQITSGNRTLVS